MKKLFLIFVFFFAAAQAEATTRYVDGNLASTCVGSTYSIASRDCSGTDGPGYKTAQEGATAAVAGDTVFFRAGTYASFSLAASGSSGSPITYQNYNSEAVLIFTSSTTVSAVDFNGKSWIVFDGFEVEGGENAILVYPGSSNNQILNNTVHGAYRAGILLWGSSNSNLVQSNTVYNNSLVNWPRGAACGSFWTPAISVQSSSSNNTIDSNIVYWNHGEGIVTGIGSSGNVTSNNIVGDSWSVNIYTDGGANETITNNFSYVSDDAKNWTNQATCGQSSNPLGIGAAVEPDSSFVAALAQLKITNNIVVNTNSGFWAFPEQAGHTFSNWDIANNTFVNNDNGIKIINSGAGTDNIRLRNNIVLGGSNQIAGNPTIQIDPGATSSTFSNNVYYNAGAMSEFYWNGVSGTNFASWVTNSSETSSLNADPSLTDTSSAPCRLWVWSGHAAPCSVATLQTQIANYKILTASNAKDAGTDLSSILTTDYFGTTRPVNSLWDIGAHEFQAAGTPPSIVIVSPSSSGSYATTASTVDVSGTASDDVSVSSVTWACATCTPASGTATGTTSWSISAITLAAGANTITVTAHDGDANTMNAVIVVTKNTTANALVLKLIMNEGSGTTVADSSGNANDGTSDCGAWATGKYGSAVQFSGSCSITVADDNTLDLTTGFTLEGWFFPTSTTSYQAGIAKNYVYYLYPSIGGWCGSTRAVLGGFDDSRPETTCDATPLTLNVWVHLAVTYDGATIKLYKDGTLLSSQAITSSMTAGTGTLQIGNDQFSEGFIGLIDEVYVYNYALDAAAIQTDMNTNSVSSTMAVNIGAGSSIQIGASASIQIGQ